MYQYCKRCFRILIGGSAKGLRSGAVLMFAGGLLALAGGCDKSDDAAEVNATEISSSDSADSSNSAPTVTAKLTDAQPSPQTQAPSPTPPAVLQVAESAGQQTPFTVPSGSAPIVFDPPVLDLSYMLPSEKKTATFEIRNVSDEPVKITLVTPSCTCTTLDDLAGTVIPPRSAVELTAELEARSKVSPLSSSIAFLFEGYAEISTITLTAQVARAIKTEPQYLYCSKGDFTGRIVVQSIDGRPFTILAANFEEPKYIEFDPETDELRNSYLLEWDVSEDSRELLPPWWLIETDHPDCPVVDVWVRHRSTQQERVPGRVWQLRTHHYVVNGIESGGSAEFTAGIAKLGQDNINLVQSLSKEFDAELVSLDRSGEYAIATVRITPVPGYQGLLYGDIEFVSRFHHQKLKVIGTALE